MNFKYLLQENKVFQNIGTKLDKRIVFFDIFQKDEKLLSSINSVFKLSNIQNQNIKRNLNELKASQKLTDEFYDEFNLIEDISNRYLIIKELLEKEKEFKFGLLGLTLYLGLTCFDSLGQRVSYKTFNEWILSKKNEQVNEVQTRINNGEFINFKIEIDKLFKQNYIPIYGVSKSFFNFLDGIKEKNSYKELLKTIEITDKCLKEKLEQHNDLESLKHMWLFNFRNDFTHNTRNLRWPLDNEWFYTSFSIDNQIIGIKIIPFLLVVNVLDSIKDGIEIKIKKLGINFN